MPPSDPADPSLEPVRPLPPPGAPVLPARPSLPSSPPAISDPRSGHAAIPTVSRLGTEANRAAGDRLRRRNATRTFALVAVALVVVAAAAVVINQLYGADQRSDDERRAELRVSADDEIDDLIDIVEDAAITNPPAPGSIASMFSRTPDPSLDTAALVAQLPLATVTPRAPDLPEERTVGFALRVFDPATGAEQASWQFSYDSETGLFEVAEVPSGEATIGRRVVVDASWQYTLLADNTAFRHPRRSGVAGINVDAPYLESSYPDLVAVIPPELRPYTYQVPVPTQLSRAWAVHGPIDAFLVDLSGLRTADPAAAAAWIDGWRIVSIDDPAAVDVGIRETLALPPPPEVLGGRGGLLRAWSIDTSWLHPPADAALVVTASSAVDSVLEFAIVAPDAGVRFQYAWNAGFDGALPVPPEIDVDGWVPG